MTRSVVAAVVGALLCAAAARAPAADARAAWRAGAAAQAVEDWPLAVERYREALAGNPAYLEPMKGLAECYLAMEEYDEALKMVSQARTYDRASADLVVLEGRIRIGLGSVPGARTLFTQVLDAQPNNVEARLGLAAADLAEGRPTSAFARYGQVLGLAPESTAAVLSLALLSDESGNQAAAAKYYELALRGHASDPRVQLAAASWMASRGSLAEAEKHAKIALDLAPGLDRARVLLGQVYLQGRRFAEAIAVLTAVVAADRSDARAWYALGLAYRRSADAPRAMSSFSAALQARPDDETSRLALEATAREALPMGDAARAKLAAVHVALGAEQEARSYLEKALAEYRRALLLEPTSRDARVGHARIWRTLGFPGKYLSELKVLAALGVKDTFVSDQVESWSSRLASAVGAAWGVDQYNMERRRYVIPVYTLPSTNRLTHPLADEDLARAFAAVLGRHDAVSVPEGGSSVGAFDEAFRAARAGATDYFVLLHVDEADRSLSMTADLYLSRTGVRVASFASFRTGNDRVRDSFVKLAADVAGTLASRGSLRVRTFGQGLVDLGTLQGLKVGDTLVIVSRGAVTLRPDGPGLSYQDRDVRGDFTVTATDETVSEGSIKGRGWFDYVNAGDEVLFAVAKAPVPDVTPVQRSGNILARLFRLGP